MCVYTIQPVVKPVVKPVWEPVVSCIQTFNRLSNPFDNRLYHVYSRLSNRFYSPVWQPVERTVAVRSTRLSNQVVQPVWQSVGCLFTRYSRSSNQLYNRLDNRVELTVCSFNTVVKPVWQPVGCLFTRYSRSSNWLYRVNGVLQGCILVIIIVN